MINNLLLLLAAAIWGFGFVAQHFGMDHLGPFAFSSTRFFVGALSLVPLLWYFKQKGDLNEVNKSQLFYASLPIGILLFSAVSLQQVGLIYTTTAKAGFITGVYVVLVPLLGIFLKHKTTPNVWVGCVFALFGMCLLCFNYDISINVGDVLELIGAFFWAGHLLTIDHFSKKYPPILLAFVQFIICGVLSLLIAFLFETTTVSNIILSWKAILFSGVMSVGIAYTLQVFGQNKTKPAHAAIILSLETVFAALGGYLILNEKLDSLALFGCGLMLIGMVLAQLTWKKKEGQSLELSIK